MGITHEYKYDLIGNRTNAVYGISNRAVDWEYDALNRITNIAVAGVGDPGPAVTEYSYDLNSKPVYREYPTGVEEFRTFDAMGRLLTMTTTNSANGESFEMEYWYDAVGSAREMVQASQGLEGKAQNATTTWHYDDRYRLTNETVVVVGGTTSVSSYTWDSADNRHSKTNHIAGALASTRVYYVNVLNQMTGYSESRYQGGSLVGADLGLYKYDDNGNRTNSTLSASGSFSYIYDEDNRLVEAVVGTLTNKFAYDYRSRRYYRSASDADHMYSIFDGGLAVQEYKPLHKQFLHPEWYLETEFIRGEGMGGGVGGMVYSITDDGIGNDVIICSHANHRGDVIARTDNNGSLTYFALYEAYGTRPYEWGSDPDRQKANTKEEETDLGLLNEGMRFRDLETGTWLTADPAGFIDGPNRYCYVHCNPITQFDAWGLSTYNPETQELDADEHLNIYDKDDVDPEDPTAGLLVKHDQMEKLLENAEDGFVTLPGGQKVKEDSFRTHVEGNKEILSESAVKGRSAQGFLEDGHMSYSEAQQVEKEISSLGSGGLGVKSWAEYWNARTALNRVEHLMDTPEKVRGWMVGRKFTETHVSGLWGNIDRTGVYRGDWRLSSTGMTEYHGPNKGVGAYKWGNKDGRELVISAQGKPETRTKYGGTYNYGKNPATHIAWDIYPYKVTYKERVSPYD